MLIVHHSNRMERLIDSLAAILRVPATEAWLEPEVVIVQSRGMERFVGVSLARLLGVSANVRYPYTAAFVWEAYRAVLSSIPDVSPFDKEVLAWRVFRLFDDLTGVNGLDPLRVYLERADSELERFELAWRIADVLDQYLVYRPDWIHRWEAGHDAHWQAVLWRRLALNDSPHRARVHKIFVERLSELTRRPTGLPARLSLIGISSLPAMYLDVLRELSRLCQVHLYLLNPCREYWGMIQAEREIARACGENETEAEELYLETGNRLLASLGRQGRDFHHLVTELDSAPDEGFEEVFEDSLLHCLQADLLNLRNRGGNGTCCDFDTITGNLPSTPLMPDDHSLQIHVCHSALREVEVLYDRLLALFEQYPELPASDVMVMTPDIDTYAPAIRAVFASADPAIPYAIADRSVVLESPVVDTFLALLELPGSRFEADHLLALLEVAAVRLHFGIAEADLPAVCAWLRDTSVRWGIDAEARAALELPATSEHTWRAGMERLLMGYAFPAAEQRMYEGILPYDPVEGDGARVMGRLQVFMRRLFTLDQRLNQDQSLDGWRQVLLQLLDDFFAADDVFEPQRNLIRDALDELLETAVTAARFEETVSLPVVRAWLRRRLNASAGVSGFLSGGVTFGAMVPMRSVPFQVICLIGLNDGAFPRPQRAVDFDLMARHPRRGDRSRRLDDRYLFLEAILSARQVLYLSYVGRGIRDNGVIPPSPLVSELLDYVRQGFHPSSGEEDDPLTQVVVEHPLQPFSRRYFEGDSRLFSYSTMLCEAARCVGRGENDGKPLMNQPLSEPEPAHRELDLRQLIWFFRSPARYFVRERLLTRLVDQDGPLENREPFLLEPFADREIRERLLRRQLEGLRTPQVLPLVRAAGLLPHGVIGEVFFQREASLVKALLKALDDTPVMSGAKPEVDIELGPFRLSGWLGNVTTNGLVDYAVEHFSARHYLELWIRHLILNQLGLPGVALTSLRLGLGQRLEFRPVANPDALLRELLELYWQGLSLPLKFFPRSALVYVETALENKTDPLGKAQRCWRGSEHSYGEGANPYYQLAFRNMEPIDEEFAALAQRVFGPLLEHRVASD